MRESSVQELFSTIDDFIATQLSPSASLIDSFPTLARLLPKPLQWYRPHAERVFRKTVRVYEAFFDDLEKRVATGLDPRCFAREMNKIADKYGFDRYQRYYCAGTIIEAGSDTTRNQINIVIAAAAKFPGWVKKAQDEIDSVCGYAERLPTFEVRWFQCWLSDSRSLFYFSFQDWERLPYVKAVIKESLRWRPNMTAAGTPRVLVQDDAIGPYRFEKGTIFTYNHFGLSHNEALYQDNTVFRPERYLDDEVDDMLKGHLGFGLGENSHHLLCYHAERPQGGECVRVGTLDPAICSLPLHVSFIASSLRRIPILQLMTVTLIRWLMNQRRSRSESLHEVASTVSSSPGIAKRLDLR